MIEDPSSESSEDNSSKESSEIGSSVARGEFDIPGEASLEGGFSYRQVDILYVRSGGRIEGIESLTGLKKGILHTRKRSKIRIKQVMIRTTSKEISKAACAPIFKTPRDFEEGDIKEWKRRIRKKCRIKNKSEKLE